MAKSLHVGIRILRDYGVELDSILACEAICNRCTIVKDISGAMGDIQRSKEAGSCVREGIEGVNVVRRGSGETESRIIRRDNTIFGGEKRDELAILVGRRREPVEQY